MQVYPPQLTLKFLQITIGESWTNTPPPLEVESYNTFTQHSSIKQQLNEKDLINYLKNINKIKEVIKRKVIFLRQAWIN
jgi:hypothetical protein